MKPIECKVCHQQTTIKEVKNLNSPLQDVDYVKTECGHKFLVEYADKKVE